MGGTKTVTSLFDARLRIPRSPIDTIPRPRIRELLGDAVAGHPVTLVIGGAGTGKTVAVAEWALNTRAARPVAWMTLDRGITASPPLWHGIVQGLRQTLGADSLTDLVVPEAVDEEFVEAFVTWIAGYEACLVLDDLHELTAAGAWDTLDHLVRLVPDTLRLVLVARHDPPLLLHRQRLGGRVAEVRAPDLDFTEPEVVELLHTSGLDLSSGDIDRLLALTEGWAAGLRLALMSLEASPDRAGALAEFNGHQSLVAGYLVEEIIRGLGPEKADFLLRTSVPDQVCGPLAGALTGGAGSARVLADLSREIALVAELKGSGWFRYHPLMRQMLRARLHAEDPDLERELHRTTAIWYESHGEWRVALRHAVESEDWDLVGQLALRSAAVLLFSADRSALADLADRIPADVAHHNPELLTALALASFSRRDHQLERSLRELAATMLPALPDTRRAIAELNLLVLDSIAARRAGDAAPMAEAAAAATALVQGLDAHDAPGWSAYRGATQALCAIGEIWSGHPHHAQELLRGALSFARPSDVVGYAALYHRGQYALAEVVAGRVTAARDLALGSLEVAEQMGARFRHEAGSAWLALAAAEMHRGDAAAATRALELCEIAADRGRDPFVAAGIHVVALRRALLLGDLPGARRELAELSRHLADHPGMTHVARLRTGLTAEVELASGLVGRARAVLAAADADSRSAGRAGEPDVLAVPRARVLLASGQAEQVRGAVAGALDEPGAVGADAWLVVALAEDRLRHDAASTEALAHALDLGAPEEARFPFLRRGDRLTAMLRRHLEVVGTHQSFVEDILRAGATPWTEPEADAAVEPLTDREMSVLAYLPTLRSNTEIAESLGISVNTVKHHLKSINRKLGVTSRRDAVRVARRYGVLPDRTAR